MHKQEDKWRNRGIHLDLKTTSTSAGRFDECWRVLQVYFALHLNSNELDILFSLEYEKSLVFQRRERARNYNEKLISKMSLTGF